MINSTSIKKTVHQKNVSIVAYENHQIWDQTPDLFHSWRTEKTKETDIRKVREVMPIIDTNWVSVDYSECIMYHEWFWNDMGYCLSCDVKGLRCDLVHPWCQCEALHVLPIQSPNDINRLRRIRFTLKMMKVRGLFKITTESTIDRNHQIRTQ